MSKPLKIATQITVTLGAWIASMQYSHAHYGPNVTILVFLVPLIFSISYFGAKEVQNDK